MPVEEMQPAAKDLVADIREESAEFDAGVQSLFDELESIRALLQQKESALQAKEALIAEQYERLCEHSGGGESNDSQAILDQFNASFARVEEEFSAAVACMGMIPEMCDSDASYESQLEQLQTELEAESDARRELQEDLTAERERSARLEASLTAAEAELAKQQAAFAEEFSKLRAEIRDLAARPGNEPESKTASEQANEPADEPRAETPAASEQPKTNSRRSKRSRRRKKR